MSGQIFLLGIFLSMGTLRAAEPYQYLGPVEMLDNGVVSLGVAPKVGRIVSYQRKGEASWIAAFDAPPIPKWHWNPWGGDHIWPAAQALNPQIYHSTGFDPTIDGQPWEVTKKSATILEMRSSISPELGLCITHRIELMPGSTQVIHSYHLERVGDSAFPVHAWTVTGVAQGDYILMESDPTVMHPDSKPFTWWREVSKDIPAAQLIAGTRILQIPWPQHTIKLGTYGRWIALVKGASALRETISYDDKALYLDCSNLEAYLGPESGKSEIETLSPTWFLRRGQSADWTVKWDLVDFAKTASDEEKAQILQTQKPK